VAADSAAIDFRFVAVLDSVVTTDARALPAISVGTIAIDVAGPGAQGARAAAIDVGLVAVFRAVIAARAHPSDFARMPRAAACIVHAFDTLKVGRANANLAISRLKTRPIEDALVPGVARPQVARTVTHPSVTRGQISALIRFLARTTHAA